MIDMHVHTARCRHAVGSAADYLAAARRRGIAVLAFTEHLPLPDEVLARDPYAAEYAMPLAELPAYVEEVLALKASSAACGGPEVLLGIEVDLHPGNESFVRSLLEGYPFDVVLGSVHYVDGWAFDDPERRDGYETWDIDELWERYLTDLAHVARSGLVDVLAHVDLVKKFGYLPQRDPRPLYTAFARAAADAGVVVEVNTAGLRKPCGELYPGQALLRELTQGGVRFTIGSDAHDPADVGAGIDEARQALADAGVTSVVSFRERRRWEVPLWER